MRLKLIIAYDGAPYAGWQSQPGGNSIQDMLGAALRQINGAPVVVHGSGRTDAGVHALAQCAHVEVIKERLSPPDWLRALNGNLPPTIRVLKATKAAPDFHARFSAKGKIYRYLIRQGPVPLPHELGRAWHHPQALDLEKLRSAVALFAGRHDFAAFAANRGTPVLDTKRVIRRATVQKSGTRLRITFEGNGFLYKMVRMMTGAAVRVARDQATLADLRARLARGGPQWTHVAPAEGLYLVRVIY